MSMPIPAQPVGPANPPRAMMYSSAGIGALGVVLTLADQPPIVALIVILVAQALSIWYAATMPIPSQPVPPPPPPTRPPWLLIVTIVLYSVGLVAYGLGSRTGFLVAVALAAVLSVVVGVTAGRGAQAVAG